MILPEELEVIGFLKNLGQQNLNRIAMIASLTEYPEGAILFKEGEDSVHVYFVLSGEVHISVQTPAGTSVQVHVARPGQLLGWSPLLGTRAMTATARAAVRSRLAALTAHQILELCDSDPLVGVALLKQVALALSERLASTRRELVHDICRRPAFASFTGVDD